MPLNVKNVAAGIYPFQHLPSPNQHLQLAQQLYDCSLNYYVDGQAWAGSPWAFHTIGSTLVINAEHYAIARGFPQREAGEDFYLLNKLGKIGKEISRLDSKPVALTTRQSDRVLLRHRTGYQKNPENAGSFSGISSSTTPPVSST